MALNFAELSLYQKILGGGAPSSAASPTGDLSARIAHIVDEVAKISGTIDISPTVDPNGSIAERLAYLQQLTPLGAGIVKHPRDWMGSAGFEFWLAGVDSNLFETTSATEPGGLDDSYGWTVAGTIGGIRTAGDLNAGDVEISPNTTSYLQSPSIFGGVSHMRMAQQFLGVAPTKLVTEFMGRWTATPSTNETVSWIGGFIVGTPSDAAAAGGAGCICSDGSNFRLVTDTQSIAGPAVDTNRHLFRIALSTSGVMSWSVDGVAQTPGTVETGIFPVSFAIRRLTGNQPRLGFTRVFYEA